MNSKAYINARLMDPESGRDELGTLIIDNGLIAELGVDVKTPSGMNNFDCQGDVLAPGLIDMQSFQVDGASAAKGGITTSLLMPDYSPLIENNITVEYILQKTGLKEPIKYQVLGTATEALKGKTMAEMGLMARSGALGFTDARKAIKSTSLMRQIIQYAVGLDLLIVQHLEDPEMAEGGVATEGDLATRMGLKGIPLEAEVLMLDRDLRLLEAVPARYHAGQVTTAKTLDAIKTAREKGQNLTCGTSPQYFALNELAITDYRTFAKVSPPLRPESDRLAIVDGLREGIIDVITSNHDPKAEDLKRLPFEQASIGIAGYETLFSLALELHHSAKLPLMTILKAITSKPAEILGLKAGQLKIGYPADLIIFNPNSPWRIEAENFLSDIRNTPFDNRPVQGRINQTIVDGNIVYTRRKS